MTMFTKILAGSAGLAAVAAAAPAAAQYGYAYPPYGNAYGYGYNNNVSQFAVDRCAAAVQSRLNNRSGVSGILGAVLGANTNARIVSVTRVDNRGSTFRVRGLASSGRYAYGPYGVGAYGAVGYNYAQPADLSFRCDVDYRGRIRDIDINRRR